MLDPAPVAPALDVDLDSLDQGRQHLIFETLHFKNFVASKAPHAPCACQTGPLLVLEAGPPQEPGARRRIECGKCHKFYYWLPKIKNINKRPPSSTGLARGAVCQCCLKAGVALVGHHVVPVADGGSDAQDNIWTVCGACHAIIHALRRMVEQA